MRVFNLFKAREYEIENNSNNNKKIDGVRFFSLFLFLLILDLGRENGKVKNGYWNFQDVTGYGFQRENKFGSIPRKKNRKKYKKFLIVFESISNIFLKIILTHDIWASQCTILKEVYIYFFHLFYQIIFKFHKNYLFYKPIYLLCL